MDNMGTGAKFGAKSLVKKLLGLRIRMEVPGKTRPYYYSLMRV